MIFLRDKIAVVTGAGSGLGQAIAELFARAGASVFVTDVDARGGAETVARITAANGRGSFLKLDVTREEDLRALATWVQFKPPSALTLIASWRSMSAASLTP
jgi:NAD(P)-dependent dehydrogenase (short-subunit alcohol dehydrogenase family)